MLQTISRTNQYWSS